jgi:hypothetical protein
MHMTCFFALQSGPWQFEAMFCFGVGMENTLPPPDLPAVAPARTDPRSAGWTGRGGFRNSRNFR